MFEKSNQYYNRACRYYQALSEGFGVHFITKNKIGELPESILTILKGYNPYIGIRN